MTKPSVVSNEYKVLLLGRQHVWITLDIFAMCTHGEVPNRHEECIVGSEVGMMTQVKLRSVK